MFDYCSAELALSACRFGQAERARVAAEKQAEKAQKRDKKRGSHKRKDGPSLAAAVASRCAYAPPLCSCRQHAQVHS